MNSTSFSVACSLKRKLLLPLLLIGAALAGATVWGIYLEFQNQMGDQVRHRAELVVNAVNYAAESISHPGELQRIVTAIGAEKEVSLIVVVGGRPARVLATTRNAWLGQALSELPAKDVAERLEEAIQTRQNHIHLDLETDEFGFASPLLLSRPELVDRSLTDGAVMVHLDMRPTQAASRQLTREFSLAFLASLAILAALGYGVIRQLVLRPISRIGKLVALRREGSGEGWAEVAGDDELGALARTLNDSLTRTDAVLHELKDQKFALDAHAIVALTDARGKITYVNDKLCAVTKHSWAELIGQDHRFLYDGHHPEEFIKGLWDTTTSGRVWKGELKNRAKDGTISWWDTTIAPFIDADGKPFQFAAISTDISERKRAEEALRDSEALYQSLVTQLPQSIFRKDPEGRFTFANQHFCRLLGKTLAEVWGRTDFDFFPRELAEKYRQDDLRVMRERRVWEEVEENALLDGKRIFVQVVKAPLVNAGGDVAGVQGIFWDVTERKRAEIERERLVVELRRALASVKSLSGLLPICAGCKKIRDDKGYWSQVEYYISQHSDVTFSHGMCPDCLKKWYPELEEPNHDHPHR